MNRRGLPEVLLRDDVNDSVIGTFTCVAGKLQPADPEVVFLKEWTELHANIIEELAQALAAGRVPPLTPQPAPALAAPAEPPTTAAESTAAATGKPSRRRRA